MIRLADKKDASRLAEILIFTKRITYRPIFRNDIVSFNEMQVLDLALDYKDNADSLKDIYVYDDGIVKGLIKWNAINEFGKENCIQIHELFVDTFFQNENIGSCLIEFCIENARQQNFDYISLWVLEKNKKARDFYEGHAFNYAGIRSFENGTKEVILCYSLVL